MKIDGNSGASIKIDGNTVIKKVSGSKGPRLVKQMLKQMDFDSSKYFGFFAPKVKKIDLNENDCTVEMDYAGSDTVYDYLAENDYKPLFAKLVNFIKSEVTYSEMTSVPSYVLIKKYVDVRKAIENNDAIDMDKGLPYMPGVTCRSVLKRIDNLFFTGRLPKTFELPVGVCHGDLTFSNMIIANPVEISLFDFLNTYLDCPLQDIVKLRQDTCLHWTELVANANISSEVSRKVEMIDKELDCFFRCNYDWYKHYYNIFQILNIARILPYAKDQARINWALDNLEKLLETTK